MVVESCVMSGKELERRRLGGGIVFKASVLDTGECALLPVLPTGLVGEFCSESFFFASSSIPRLAGATVPSGRTMTACCKLWRRDGSLITRGCCL